MASLKMNIQSRSDVGSNYSNKLRQQELIPGIIYSRGEETRHVQVDSAEFLRVYRVAGTTSIIDLELEGKTYPVIIKELQKHPVKNQYLHIDFQELSADETIKMLIPINLINRDEIRLQPSVLTQLIDEVEIECLPADIPSVAEVDVVDIDFTTPVLVKDLDIAKNEKITMLTDVESVICTLSEPSYNEEELEASDADTDVEVPLVSEEEEDQE